MYDCMKRIYFLFFKCFFISICDTFDNQNMEPLGQQIEDNKQNTQTVGHEIRKGLQQYLQNTDRKQVWTEIFKIIENCIVVKASISQQSQKSINAYLKRQKQIQHPLDQFIVSKKKIICNFYDAFLAAQLGSVHNAVISGRTSEFLLDFYKETLQPIANNYQRWKILCLCVQAVAFHICQFLQKSKSCLTINTGKRQMCICLNNDTDFFTSNQQMAAHIFQDKLCLLIDYFNTIKPLIINYLNIQSLLEITSKNYQEKECFVTCLKDQDDDGKYFGGKIKLSKILGDNVAGRIAIQNTLQELEASQIYRKITDSEDQISEKKVSDLGWSIITLPQQFQYNIQCVLEKLPIFLKPRSNGDILSFQRVQFLPTFTYQLIKPKYYEGPFHSQLSLAIFNVGKLSIEIISFPFTQISHENHRISPLIFQEQFLVKNNIYYTKVLVTPKNLAVIPTNSYYLVGCTEGQQLGLVQLISWNLLPKVQKQINNFFIASTQKRLNNTGEYMLPRSLILFDFLNHQLNLFRNSPEIPEIIRAFLSQLLNEQQEILSQALKKCKEPRISSCNLSQYKKFCDICLGQLINYYAIKRSQTKQIMCMKCIKSQYLTEKESLLDKKVKFKTIYSPQNLRYPLNLAKLFSKNKVVASDIENKYETNICTGKFIGAYETEICQGRSLQPNDVNKQEQMVYEKRKSKDRFFANKQTQYNIIAADKSFTTLALSIPKSQEDKQCMKKKLQNLVKSIKNKQQLKAQLFPKYSQQNLVLTAMCYLQNLSGLI